MIRWLLIGSMLFGLGTGLQRGWITIDWCRFMAETKLPTLNSLQPDATPVCPPPATAVSP
ncbi:hypothetical protein KBY66_07075 [Synechococcus sp. Tobar12-5m-g]|jgi:hypothetical protein|uniref:hypothetical protein n=1 Tax=unclassified Synechococcus TaxID=2626047 RepID=UPI0020CFAE86|nr:MULTISPECIES: hypothetical protein [unclassified Synechococcus]MCP9772387.1 hypothetical protein [Synechococcus sp. Tobar12-5m-g]MCP9873974.1 hypothetical protein [Synechococcus sp. Cruz CV-v-12]